MELQEMMEELLDLKTDYRAKQKAFKDSTKDQVDTIKSLENLITNEVLKRKETVKFGKIRAEYRPQVVIKIKKDKSNGN